MKFLLDPNICIYIIKQKPAKVLEKFQRLNPSDVGISSITLAELEYGIVKSQQSEKNRMALNQFLISLEIVKFDEKASNIYGVVRAELERKGLVIGAMDMLIAAHAISLDLILVTNNVKEFSRIPNLRLENWAK